MSTLSGPCPCAHVPVYQRKGLTLFFLLAFSVRAPSERHGKPRRADGREFSTPTIALEQAASRPAARTSCEEGEQGSYSMKGPPGPSKVVLAARASSHLRAAPHQ